MHISYVVLNFHLICTSWDFWIVGRPRQHNTHNCFAWVRHSFWTQDGAAREPRLSSCDQAQFLSFSFSFNFNFLILIFRLFTSFSSRKAGLIAGCTWPYSDVALGPYRLSSTVARLYHEFNSDVARLLRRQSTMFGRIPYWFIVIIYAFSSCTAAAQRLNVIIV